MRRRLSDLLEAAKQERLAVPAFNVYALDQAAGVLDAAHERRVPVILQVLPHGLGDQREPLIAGLRAAADRASVPTVVHLDHCASLEVIEQALASGADSVMADGSELSFQDNVEFTRRAVEVAARAGGEVEAELGRLAGSEDGMDVDEREARLTDPGQARKLVENTGVAALAVCVGNVHGSAPRTPELDLERLARIEQRCPVPLVLHGASGLPQHVLPEVVRRGVAKINVNTEVRIAYRTGLRDAIASGADVTAILGAGRHAAAVAAGLFIDRIGSAGLADRD